MHKLRVIQVGLDCVPQMGGTVTAIRDFHEAMEGEVVSLTSPDKMPWSVNDHVLHVPTHRGVAGRYYSWSAAGSRRHAEQLLHAADLIVIHGLFRYHAQWAWSVARDARIPYWVVPHGTLDSFVFTYRGWQKKSWMAVFGRSILRNAAHLIFATARERVKSAPNMGSSDATVVHWPVKCPTISDREAVRARARSHLGISQDARVLMFLGRLHPIKRVLETIKILHRCRDCELHLVVVGPDSYELTGADCQRYVERLGVRGVHFPGAAYGAAKEEFFQAADAFINLSLRENFGYTVAEALAHGLPVLLSPGNDLIPELEPLRCGWFLQSLNVEEAVATVQEFARTPLEELRAMGERGRDWVRRVLSRERFARRLTVLAQETVRSWDG